MPMTDLDDAQLGEKIAEFQIRQRGLKRWLNIAIGILLILSTIVSAVIMFQATWLAVNIHGRAVILRLFSPSLILYPLTFLTGFLFIFNAFRLWSAGIDVYEYGFIRHKNWHKKHWYWDQTSRLDNRVKYIKFGGSTVSLQTKTILEDDQQNRVILHNRYNNMEDLIYLIRLRILPGLKADAHDRLRRGETIKFNQKLKAVEGGLMINDELVPWSDINEPMIKNGVLKLNRANNPDEWIFRSSNNHIKNMDLLIELLDDPPVNQNQSSPR